MVTYFSWQDETHLCHKTNLYPYISSSLFFYFFFLFSKAFFCSLANLRSTFFTSSAAGRFSGTIPRCTSIFSNSSIVGNMLLAYTTFSLKVFGLYIHARHFCRKIFCFDTDSGEEICQWSFLGDSHASLQRCSIQTK